MTDKTPGPSGGQEQPDGDAEGATPNETERQPNQAEHWGSGSHQSGAQQPGEPAPQGLGEPSQQAQAYQWQAYQQPHPQNQGHQTYPIPGYPAGPGGGAQQGQAQPPHQTQHLSQVPQPPPPRGSGNGLRGRTVAAVAALALVVGGVAGGVSGYAGYQLGAENTSGPSALETPTPAKNANAAPQGSVQRVAQKVLPSVVQLQMSNSLTGKGGEGSGVVISPDGLILTNNHVVEGAQGAHITAQFNDHRQAPVKVVGTDPSSDVAVVKAQGMSGLTPAQLGNSDGVQTGQQVVAIGSPFGLQGTVTSGIVSAKHRPVRAGGERGSQNTVLDALQTDAAINPGNSGGPLVNMDGQVVGVNSAIYSPSSGGGLGGKRSQGGSVGLGFAIPINQAKRIAKELKETGHATQASLGVLVNARPTGTPGAEVIQAQPGQPAQQAGIRDGDRITALNGRQVEDSDALIAGVRAHAPGERVKVTVQRGSSQRTVDVVLGGKTVGG